MIFPQVISEPIKNESSGLYELSKLCIDEVCNRESATDAKNYIGDAYNKMTKYKFLKSVSEKMENINTELYKIILKKYAEELEGLYGIIFIEDNIDEDTVYFYVDNMDKDKIKYKIHLTFYNCENVIYPLFEKEFTKIKNKLVKDSDVIINRLKSFAGSDDEFIAQYSIIDTIFDLAQARKIADFDKFNNIPKEEINKITKTVLGEYIDMTKYIDFKSMEDIKDNTDMEIINKNVTEIQNKIRASALERPNNLSYEDEVLKYINIGKTDLFIALYNFLVKNNINLNISYNPELLKEGLKNYIINNLKEVQTMDDVTVIEKMVDGMKKEFDIKKVISVPDDFTPTLEPEIKRPEYKDIVEGFGVLNSSFFNKKNIVLILIVVLLLVYLYKDAIMKHLKNYKLV
jgi:hypothetical protein